ncbi:Uncharacterised protein [Klebsiella pneumoniae]|nr:Uncharacterised protein [Klebsiella pneumoniae]
MYIIPVIYHMREWLAIKVTGKLLHNFIEREPVLQRQANRRIQIYVNDLFTHFLKACNMQRADGIISAQRQ